MQQKTIENIVQCSGVGLHTGKEVSLTLRPACEDTGIVFHSVTSGGCTSIRPEPEAVVSTGLATTLGRDGAHVSTVEHLLAALRGLAVDNVHVDVCGGEVPILDGSAAPFVDLVRRAGVRVQARPRRVLRVTRPLTYEDGEKFIRAEPFNGFAVDCLIDFPHPSIGRQRMSLHVTPQNFAEVAGARTFGFLRDVELLQSRGLALGGSLANAVVLDNERVLNTEGLRYPDEFVRHKLLDFIGDMAMLPLPLQGMFTIRCSGHGVNNMFLRRLASLDGYLKTVTLAPSKRIVREKADYPAPAALSPIPALAG